MRVRTQLGTHRMFVWVLAWTVVVITATAKAEKNYFPSFADEHTLGLWLFDETDYPYTTLTDAGKFEYDLRLMKGGKLVAGKYGNCLKCTPGLDYAASYAAWKGAVGFNHMREMSGRPGSGLFGPTIAPEQLLHALAGDFTCEFWLLLMSNPIQDVALIDLGDRFEPGLIVTLRSRARGFVVENAYAGFKAVCPAILDQLWGRAWHHIAFTYSASDNKLHYYIDGQAQEPVRSARISKSTVPPSVRPKSIADTTMGGIFEKEDRAAVPNYDKRMPHRFNFAIGHNRHGEKDFNGNIDELRFSNVIRYTGNFGLPDSFSRNLRKGAAKPGAANGPPLLFGADKTYLPNEPVMLGSRKHVFIDEVMVDRKRNIKLTLNPPSDAVVINEKAAWDASFFEHQGKIYTVVSEGYEGDEGPINLLVSQDGLKFDRPNLGLIEHNGTKNNNLIMLGLPSWGKYFKDPNPACPPEELFKATLWVGQRGIYLYFSPDTVHWRRNETCMLPLVSGGGCETFWDDQQRVYFNYIKRDGSYNSGDYPNYGRSTAMFKSCEINKPWPFDPAPNPYYEGWPFPAVTGEGLTVMGPNLADSDHAQIFRTRPQKYHWAPDTYVAFTIRSGCDMAVSRDAVNWNICSESGLGYYLPPGKTVDGRGFSNAEIANGLIRRGNDIWQYANCNILGTGKRATIRVTQRLDGFLSLDAAQQAGTVITEPFIFEGNKLTVNADVKGYLKVAILNLPGLEITGFNIGLDHVPKKPVVGHGLRNCDLIKGNSVRHVVSWRGDSEVGTLVGQLVRLRFELQNAKLYAFKFE